MRRVAVYAAYNRASDGEVTGIGRSSVLFDEVVVAVDAERLPALAKLTRPLANVRCEARTGSIEALARATGASHVVRTISTAADSAVALADADADVRAFPALVSIIFYGAG
ncbi:MAG: hypothetical protein JWP97_5479 [Labilithrix sp.]|nr:hypothetical protein [Labilithrix sp.]